MKTINLNSMGCNIIKHITICTLLFVSIVKSFAQQKGTFKNLQYRLSLSAGLGGGFPQQDAGGIGGNVEFAVQKNKNVLALGVTGTSEFRPILNSNITNSVEAVNLYYGRTITSKKLTAIFNAGLSYVSTRERGQFLYSERGLFGKKYYEELKTSGLGMPISIKGIYEATNFMGFGVELFANINKNASFYGAAICWQFGRLRLKDKK
jgi:hypothetical protein